MRIGLVGYFGWGNFGDELFVKVFKKTFENHELLFFHDPLQGRLLDNVDELINSVDAIIIGGGDLIIPWYQSWLYWDSRYLAKPVFVYGVGVPTWGGNKPEVIDHYKNFLSHKNVKTITCRDFESVEWIRNNLGIDTSALNQAPDIVASFCFPKRSTKSNTICLILRSQTNYHKEAIYKIYEDAIKKGYHFKVLLLGTDRTQADDFVAVGEFPFPNCDIISRNNINSLIDELKNSKLIISMKFHGIVASYFLKIPFVSMSKADKFVSFCKQTNNSHLLTTWDDPGAFDTYLRALDGDVNFDKLNDIVDESNSGLEKLKLAVRSC